MKTILYQALENAKVGDILVLGIRDHIIGVVPAFASENISYIGQILGYSVTDIKRGEVIKYDNSYNTLSVVSKIKDFWTRAESGHLYLSDHDWAYLYYVLLSKFAKQKYLSKSAWFRTSKKGREWSLKTLKEEAIRINKNCRPWGM